MIIDCVMNYVIPRYKGTIYPDELFEIFTVFVPALGSGQPLDLEIFMYSFYTSEYAFHSDQGPCLERPDLLEVTINPPDIYTSR